MQVLPYRAQGYENHVNHMVQYSYKMSTQLTIMRDFGLIVFNSTQQSSKQQMMEYYLE